MKTRLLTTACFMAALPALALLPLPAKADFVVASPDNGKEDVFMFLNDTKAPTMQFTGSTTGNGAHSTDSVIVNTPVNVDTSSGFATIKPDSGLLTSLLFTPNTHPPAGQGPFTFDGFFVRAQMIFTGTGTAPLTTDVFLDVNGGASVVGGKTFTFAETLPESNDFAAIGFDEPQILGVDKHGNPVLVDDEAHASLIKSVRFYVTDTDVSFKEVKQIQWSVCNGEVSGCGAVINPTGSVPEISTWAMMLLGFCGISVMTLRNRRNGRQFRLV